MKAYSVNYKVAGSVDSTIVLVDDNETIEEALAKKDMDFHVDSSWCSINHKKELPLSMVKIRDLSITEFQMILKN